LLEKGCGTQVEVIDLKAYSGGFFGIGAKKYDADWTSYDTKL